MELKEELETELRLSLGPNSSGGNSNSSSRKAGVNFPTKRNYSDAIVPSADSNSKSVGLDLNSSASSPAWPSPDAAPKSVYASRPPRVPPQQLGPSTSGNHAVNNPRPVVGWPPIRSSRMNSLALNSNNTKPNTAAKELPAEEQAQKQPEPEPRMYVKAKVDGLAIGRKVDLKSYDGYDSLKQSLGDMFQRRIDGSEYVLTHEDKDGDWMLVGDVPWEMFLTTVRRLRVMKGSDAIGLGSSS